MNLNSLTLSTSTIPYTATAGSIIATISGVSAALPSISISGAPSNYEGDTGQTAFNFTVTRSNSTGTASVNYTVGGYGSNAANAADFGGALPTGIINFADGETSKPLSINVSGDLVVELDEQFQVTLSNPSGGYLLGSASAVATILNDDPKALTFLPTANLAAYWDAADITGKTDGQTVTTWTDRVSGITATAPSGYEPTYKTSVAGGKPSLRFNGTKRMVIQQAAALVSAMASPGRNWSIAIFYKNAVDTGWNDIFGQGYDTNCFFQAGPSSGGASHQTADYLGTTSTDVHMVGYSGLSGANTGALYLDGTCFSEPAPQYLDTSKPIAIGSSGGGGINSGNAPDNSGFSGDILGFAIYSAGLAPPQMLQTYLYACANWGQSSPLAGLSRFIVVDGDSQSSGANGGWSRKLAASKGLRMGGYACVARHSASVASGSGGGLNGNNLVDWAPTMVDGFRAVTALPTSLLWFEWYNQRSSDVPSVNSISVPAALAYNSARKSADSSIKIITGTAIDSWADQPNQAGRNAYIAGIVAGVGQDATALIDLNPNVGLAGSAPSTVNGSNTYFGDGVHENSTGEIEIANVFAPLLLNDGSLAPTPTAVPANTTAPTTTGTGTIGQVLSGTTGGWTQNPYTYAFKWTRNGTAISGATSATYTLVSADGGTSVKRQVAGTNAIGTSAYVDSSNAVSVAAPPAAYTFSNTGISLADGTLASAVPGLSLLAGTQTDGIVVKGGTLHMQPNIIAYVAGGVVRQTTGANPYMEFVFTGDNNYPYVVLGKDASNFVTLRNMAAQAGTNSSVYPAAFNFDMYQGFVQGSNTNPTAQYGVRAVLGVGDTIRLYTTGTTVKIYIKPSGGSSFTLVPASGDGSSGTIDFSTVSGYVSGQLGNGMGVGYYTNRMGPWPYAEYDFAPFNIYDGA